MKAIKYHGDDRVELIDVDLPVAGQGEALVRITATTVCGSERHPLRTGRPTNAGHEAAGVVEAAPPGSAFVPGETVGMSAVVGCGGCRACAVGREMLCAVGPTCLDGWHAEYVSVPVAALRRVPQDLDSAIVTLLTGDALGVPARAFRRVPTAPGETVIVLGLGPVGLAHTLVRAYAGCRVLAVEPSAYRRKLALTVGAAETLEPGELREQGRLVIECSGVPSVIAGAFDLVENGGTVLQSGECATPVPLKPSDVFIRREIAYTGAWYYGTEDYATMVDLVAAGLPLMRLVTHDVPASEAPAAYADFLTGRSGKVVLRW